MGRSSSRRRLRRPIVIRAGRGTITITDKYVDFAALTADPDLGKGRFWFREDINKLRFSKDGVAVTNVLKEDDPLNLAQISGVALTGRDWSLDFAKLQNIDVAHSTLATESSLTAELTRKVKGDQGLLKQVSATDLRLDIRSTIEGDTVGLAKDATLTSVLTRVARSQYYEASRRRGKTLPINSPSRSTWTTSVWQKRQPCPRLCPATLPK